MLPETSKGSASIYKEVILGVFPGHYIHKEGANIELAMLCMSSWDEQERSYHLHDDLDVVDPNLLSYHTQ